MGSVVTTEYAPALANNYRRRLVELRAERRATARVLREAGWSLRRIAAALGVSHVTVLHDLAAPGPAPDSQPRPRPVSRW